MFKVLIVDDNADDRCGLENFVPWESLKCIVVGVAENGQDGVNKALFLTPDIIITDISMPIMDGIEMTRVINEKIDNVHFIYMSCFDNFDFAVSAITYGISAYILKPIDIDNLVHEISKITSQIDSANKKTQLEIMIKKQVDDSRSILIEKFLINLLIGSINENSVINEQASFLGLSGELQYRIVIIQSEYVENVLADESSYTSLNHLKNLLYCDSILTDENGYYLSYDSLTVILILKETYINIDDMIDKFHNLQEHFVEQTGDTATICVSNVACSLYELSSGFNSLLNFIKYERFSKNGSVIISNDINLHQHDEKSIIANNIYSEISEIMASGNKSAINDFVDKCYTGDAMESEVHAKALSFHIMSVVNILLIEQNESFANIFESEISVWGKIMNYNTILNITQWMKNVLMITMDFLLEKKTDRSGTIVSDIKTIIDENYASFQTLDQIVDKMFISAGYASKLFKEDTGHTIFEYLLKKRMTEAKQLLKNKDLKSYEIGQLIGYSSNTYFTTVFKKYTGMTPNEYRQNL